MGDFTRFPITMAKTNTTQFAFRGSSKFLGEQTGY